MKLPLLIGLTSVCVVSLILACSAAQKKIESGVLTETDKACADALAAGTADDMTAFCIGVVIGAPIAQAVVDARNAPELTAARLAKRKQH